MREIAELVGKRCKVNVSIPDRDFSGLRALDCVIRFIPINSVSIPDRDFSGLRVATITRSGKP